MKQRIMLVLTGFAALTACQAPESVSLGQGGEPLIREVPAEEQAAEDAARREREADYLRRLATAPRYRSAIRDEMIAAPDRYRSTYRTIIDNFRGLPQEFGCTYDSTAIAAAQRDGWQLVRCDNGTATLFRENAASRDCGRHGQSIPDVYATLTLSPLPTVGREATRTVRQRLYGFLGRFGGQAVPDTAVAQFTPVLGADPPRDAVFALSGTASTDQFSVLSLRDAMVAELHRPKLPGDCNRNAQGFAIAETGLITLDAPLETYADMRAALRIARGYLAAR